VGSALNVRLGDLFRLQDLEVMIREASDPALRKGEEEMGFAHNALEQLDKARQQLIERIDARDLRLYDRVSKKMHHAIVPVEERTCLGCYIALPTSAVPLSSDPDQLLTCENCGRILYWIE